MAAAAHAYDTRRTTAGWTDARRNSRDIDAARERIESLAMLMDSALRVPGTSITIGADSVIGLVPVLGNIATTAISGYIIWEARRMGVPTFTLARMVGNVGLDAAITSVPLLGNVADVFFKANRRNIALLRKHFDNRAERARQV